MSLNAIPPKEAITPRPRKVIQELQNFQQVQYEFLQKMEQILREEETEFNEEVSNLVNIESESYDKIWRYIDTL